MSIIRKFYAEWGWTFLFFGAVLVVSCIVVLYPNTGPKQYGSASTYWQPVTALDGHEVDCIVAIVPSGVAISCDW